jgi:hypothetical protein
MAGISFLRRSSVGLVEQGHSLDPRPLSRICVYWGLEEKEERSKYLEV